MNFKQMEYILEIYHEGSMTKAAEKLYISQPALSQQLQKFEREIGTPLFDRMASRLIPTYAGQYYLNMMEKIVYENHQALKFLEDMHSLNRGRLVIGISRIRSIQFLPSLLPSFHRKYPGIDIEIREAPALALPEMVNRDEIDFALMIAGSDQTDLKFIPVLTEHVILAVPADFPVNDACRESVKKQGHVDFSLLKDEPFIFLKKGHRLRNIAYQLFEKAGISPNIVLQTEDVNLAHHLASTGLGLTLIGEIAATLTQVRRAPCYYPVQGENCTWQLGIACHPEKYISSSMRAFINHILEETHHHSQPDSDEP